MLADRRRLQDLLHYIQRFGEHNISLLKQLTGIENVEEIIKGLNILVGPSPRFSRLDLSLFHTVIRLSRRSFLRPVDFYYLLDGFITAALRDSLSPNTVLLSVVFPYDKWFFVQVFDRLEEVGLVEDYRVFREYRREIFPIDFSTFDFDGLKFSDDFILNSPRFSFQLPDLADGFKPDWYDVVILGKRQEDPLRSWDDIGRDIGLSGNDVLFHYFDHVVGRGLVDAFYAYVGRVDFRISLLVHDVNDEIVRELTRIPTLLRVSYLHNDKMYFYIIGQDHMFVKITEFINTLSNNYGFAYDLYLHPITPSMNFSVASSIPYEHFSKEGKWIISEEELLNVFEKELARIKKENNVK
ncbi:hypothetical protein [Saccharolobus caldissimus]|uniref:Uncharacterized protein n=1 Tax=Saccharolobus caldissimus TaxID=1702097 RepID=A0AAQ4CUY2_9CREN|nr:hypothetical protein [Saccharolobus caldissimus]BDB99613.1 hypothetical protein SACC_26300 [Saccharolobus caldissimus]